MGRIVITDWPHHVTQRGNYKQETFDENADYLRYLKWIAEYCKKYKLSILAFCLMPNHVHFIAIPHEKDSLSKTFNTCHMRYSHYHNRKKHVTGHLWQGRFYSCALGEEHLYEAIRYVENNPVRAKLAKRAEDWKWSSAKSHLGEDKSILPLERVSNYLDIHNWREYLREEHNETIRSQIVANTLTGRPSGSENFVAKLEKLFGKRLRPLPEGRPKIGKN